MQNSTPTIEQRIRAGNMARAFVSAMNTLIANGLRVFYTTQGGTEIEVSGFADKSGVMPGNDFIVFKGLDRPIELSTHDHHQFRVEYPGTQGS